MNLWQFFLGFALSCLFFVVVFAMTVLHERYTIEPRKEDGL